jgi:hypothetical protein
MKNFSEHPAICVMMYGNNHCSRNIDMYLLDLRSTAFTILCGKFCTQYFFCFQVGLRLWVLSVRALYMVQMAPALFYFFGWVYTYLTINGKENAGIKIAGINSSSFYFSTALSEEQENVGANAEVHCLRSC